MDVNHLHPFLDKSLKLFLKGEIYVYKFVQFLLFIPNFSSFREFLITATGTQQTWKRSSRSKEIDSGSRTEAK